MTPSITCLCPFGNPKIAVAKNCPIHGKKSYKGRRKSLHLVEVTLPFLTETFKAAWTIWIEYRWAEHKFKFKSVYSEQSRLNSLYRMSKGNEEWALQIMEQSMSNGWEGMFQLPLKSTGERDETRKAKPTGGTASRQYNSLNATSLELFGKLKQLESGGTPGTPGKGSGGMLGYDG